MKSSKSKVHLRKSIILDAIHPRDFRELKIQYCCEQCSYFHYEESCCTMGFRATLHLKQAQLELYERTGRMAICRMMEID